MTLALTLVIALYILFLIVLIGGFASIRERGTTQPIRKISVVVAMRNESGNIDQLIKGLRAQAYTNYEVILVDDHSTDGTLELINRIKKEEIVVEGEGHGKKAALTTGIGKATGEIIVTTDADCSLHPTWLTGINDAFDSDSSMAIGGVRLNARDTFFHRMQRIEFSSVIGTGLSLAALRNPLMCNGANLAFRREAFYTAKGYEGNMAIASGDDEFLLRKFVDLFGTKAIRVLTGAGSVVTTGAHDSLGAFIEQRKRWASKWKLHTSALSSFVGLFVFIFQFLWMVAIVRTIIAFNTIILLLLLLKMIVEGVLLYGYCRRLMMRFSLDAFLALQILYPLYVIYTGLAANFFNYSWKGRDYR